MGIAKTKVNRLSTSRDNLRDFSRHYKKEISMSSTGFDSKGEFMKRETWCALEMKKEQDWCRAQRKHYGEQFNSTVFAKAKPETDQRCTFVVNAQTHREKRHFKDKYNQQLRI